MDDTSPAYAANAPISSAGARGPLERVRRTFRARVAGTYISFEGEVSWEREHGLQVVIEDGVRIGKVGPYDGHVTHAAAAADLSLLGTVYR